MQLLDLNIFFVFSINVTDVYANNLIFKQFLYRECTLSLGSKDKCLNTVWNSSGCQYLNHSCLVLGNSFPLSLLSLLMFECLIL